MTFFTNQQLQSVISQLDQALYNHEQWYKNLLRVLIAHVPPEAPDLMPDAHRRCRFGQWYESLPAAFLQDYPTFASLGRAHEKMHSGARTLLQRTLDDLPISSSDLDQFNNILDRMRLEVQALRHEFADMAQNRDPLTGARNRASLLSDLREQHGLVQRGVHSCALAMLDLDHFKRINDEYGHTAGDAALISTVQCLQALLRPYDRIYRYGGEEFLLCMPGTTLDEACGVAERMHTAISAQSIQFDNAGRFLQVTASFGVAALAQSRSVEDSIDRADKAMYEAKTTGRNRVVAEAQPPAA
ncbi:MAG: diguanylate cyclase, partial [Sulfuritalea sp.]|nr:diguanylate cyclase [Sulfuritalea sp.]